MSLSFNDVGINLSGAKIQVVEVANEGDKFYINRIDEEFFSELLDFNFKEAKIMHPERWGSKETRNWTRESIVFLNKKGKENPLKLLVEHENQNDQNRYKNVS